MLTTITSILLPRTNPETFFTSSETRVKVYTWHVLSQHATVYQLILTHPYSTSAPDRPHFVAIAEWLCKSKICQNFNPSVPECWFCSRGIWGEVYIYYSACSGRFGCWEITFCVFSCFVKTLECVFGSSSSFFFIYSKPFDLSVIRLILRLSR